MGREDGGSSTFENGTSGNSTSWSSTPGSSNSESSTSGTSVSTFENWTSEISTSGTSACGKKNPGNGTTRMLGNSPDAEKGPTASNKEHVKSGFYGGTQCGPLEEQRSP